MQAPVVSPTPDASHTRPGRRLASLDGLRGIAALSILIFHGWLYTMPVPEATNRSSFGDYAVHELRLAVVLFFVLSGFLLSRPWITAALDGRPTPALGRYLRSRAARILPAYQVAVIGSIALLWGLDGTPGLRLPPAGELPLFFVFGQNFAPGSVLKLNPPMWTLATEVSFYALLPVIGWLMLRVARRRRSLAIVPLALIALGVLYNWSIAGRELSMTFSKTLLAMLPYFALGMLGALLAHGRTIGMRAKRRVIAAGAAIVLADAIVKSAAPAAGIDATVPFSIMRDLPSAVGFTLVVSAFALAPRSAVVGGRALAALGTVSYGVYLWHVPVYMVLRGHGLLPLNPVLAIAVAFPPVLALAAISWFVLERPALRWMAGRERRREPEPRLGGRGVERGAGGRDLGRAEVSTVRA